MLFDTLLCRQAVARARVLRLLTPVQCYAAIGVNVLACAAAVKAYRRACSASLPKHQGCRSL
jgi:hypothetical protein